MSLAVFFHLPFHVGEYHDVLSYKAVLVLLCFSDILNESLLKIMNMSRINNEVQRP